jgi:tetratricopeptide (TPR) repeat protein
MGCSGVKVLWIISDRLHLQQLTSTDYYATYSNYARLLSTCGRFDELKTVLNKALTMPTVSKETIYHEYAIMHEIQGNPEAAINDYVKAGMNTFDVERINLYKQSIERCKMKLELGHLLNPN